MYGLFAFVFQNSFLLRGIILFGFGIIIGSLLNMVIYRLPIILNRQWQKDCDRILEIDHNNLAPSDEEITLIHPSSHCQICKAKIPFWANIPIVGYFLLNGKCFNCKTNISMRYPLVELVTGLLFVIAGYYSNDAIILPAHLIFISFSICLILIDYDTMLLPDELTLSLLWLGLLFNLHGLVSGSLIASVIGAVIGYIFLWLVFWLFKLITKRDGMGYGDFKFLSAILAWLGFMYIVPVLLIASVCGIIYFVCGRIAAKVMANTAATGRAITNHQIPFGPFLGIAGIFLLIGGNDNYIRLFF